MVSLDFKIVSNASLLKKVHDGELCGILHVTQKVLLFTLMWQSCYKEWNKEKRGEDGINGIECEDKFIASPQSS